MADEFTYTSMIANCSGSGGGGLGAALALASEMRERGVARNVHVRLLPRCRSLAALWGWAGLGGAGVWRHWARKGVRATVKGATFGSP